MKRKLCLVTLAATTVALVASGLPKISEAKAYAGDASSSVSFPEGYGSTRMVVVHYGSSTKPETATVDGTAYGFVFLSGSFSHGTPGYAYVEIPCASATISDLEYEDAEVGDTYHIYNLSLDSSWKIYELYSSQESKWKVWSVPTAKDVAVDCAACLLEGYYTCTNSDVNGYKAIDEIQEHYIDNIPDADKSTFLAKSITDKGYSTTVTASAKIAQMHAMNGTSSAGLVIATSSIGNNAYVFVIAISSAAVFVSATAIIVRTNRKKRKEQK